MRLFTSAILVASVALLVSCSDASMGHVAEADGLAKAGRHDEARAKYQAALAINPDNGRAKAGLARVETLIREAGIAAQEKKDAERRKREEREAELKRKLRAEEAAALRAKLDQIKAQEQARSAEQKARDAQLLARKTEEAKPEPAPAAKPAVPQPLAPIPQPQPAAPQTTPQPQAAPQVLVTGKPVELEDGTLQFEAEAFSGGEKPVEGRDFHDTTPGNRGGRLRETDVDIYRGTDNTHYVLGAVGEWVHFEFTGGGRYEVDVRAILRGTARMRLEVDGRDATGRIEMRQTQQAYEELKTGAYFDLPEGKHDLRIIWEGGGLGLDWIRLRKVTLLDVPSSAEQKKVEDDLRDAFKAMFAKRSTEDRKLLARALVEQATQTNDDPLTRFVLLREGREVAVKAGDAEIAFSAVEEMSRTHRIDEREMKIEVLDDARSAAKSAILARPLTQAYLDMAAVMVAEEAFEEAASLLGKAEPPARAARDAALLTEVRDKKKQASDLAKAFRPVKSALARLEKSPDDSRANLTVGEHRCFVQGDWETGLAHLAKGSDRTLAALAAQEIEKPADSAAMAALGRSWADAAKRKTRETKELFNTRALHWYDRALVGATGLLRVKLEEESRKLSESMAAEGGAQGLVFWLEPSKNPANPSRDHAGGSRAQTVGTVRYDPATKALDASQGSLRYAASPQVAAVSRNGTVTAWIYSDDYSHYGAILSRADNQVVDFGVHVQRLNRFQIYINYPMARGPFAGVATLTNGQWHHVAVSWDDTNLRFTLDGKEARVAQHQGAAPVRIDTLLVSEIRVNQRTNFNGRIGYIKLFNRTLDETELARMFAGERRKYQR